MVSAHQPQEMEHIVGRFMELPNNIVCPPTLTLATEPLGKPVLFPFRQPRG